MRKLRILLGHELQHYIFAPFFYIVCALFLFLMGMVFLFSVKVYAAFPQEEPLMMSLFKSMWLPLLLIVPIFTTKAIASEKAENLLDMLLLLDVGSFSIVLAKFLAIYITYIGLWSVVIFYPEFLQHIASSSASFGCLITSRIRWGGWLFVNLIGGSVIAFGLWISSLTKTSAISMAASMVGIFSWLISGQILKHLSNISSHSQEILTSLYEDWNVFFQLEDFCHGIFDTRIIIAYLTATVGILWMTTITLRKY